MFVISIVAYLSSKCNVDVNNISALLYYVSIATITTGISWIKMIIPIVERIFLI